MHSTRMPGVVAEGSRPDARVEAMAVMSTKPLGSPPLQVIVRGVSRGISPAVTVLLLLHLNAAAPGVTAICAVHALCHGCGSVRPLHTQARSGIQKRHQAHGGIDGRRELQEGGDRAIVHRRRQCETLETFERSGGVGADPRGYGVVVPLQGAQQWD